MAEAPDRSTLARALVDLACRLPAGDPLRDEPATVFRPLDPEAAPPEAASGLA